MGSLNTKYGVGPVDIDDGAQWYVALTGIQSVIVALADVADASELREHDAIVYDPNDPNLGTYPERLYKFYFTALVSGVKTVWVTFSADGATGWTPPVQAAFGGRPSEDPTILTKLSSTDEAHRVDGKLIIYVEDDSGGADVWVHESADGITWTAMSGNPVIAQGGSSAWDEQLAGSPCAVFDGTNYILGYEGISATNVDSFGIASGTSPNSLTKSVNNPVWTFANDPYADAMVPDHMFEGADGSSIILSAHSGIPGVAQVWWGFTFEMDPTAWVDTDIATFLYDESAVRNDLTPGFQGGGRARFVTGNLADTKLGTVQLWGTLPPAPTITTTSLDPITEGDAFLQTISAMGAAPITWAVTAGTIPAGLSLSTGGVITGTPTTAGAYDFTVTATNAGGTDTQQYTGTVTAASADPSYFTGGTVTVSGGYRYHTFNTSGTLTFVDVDGPINVDYLVVAGGGGGGSGLGGGGGGGGYLSATGHSLGATQTITVGAGGAAATDGASSSLGAIAVSTGGGSGGSVDDAGGAGGSGGGAGRTGAVGTGTVGQGNNGGAGFNGVNPNQGGGGGGGASEVGANANTSGGGADGGDGSAWLDGVTRAGGGGGYCRNGTQPTGVGGAGGGGNAAAAGTSTVGTAGSENTGGGGGGGGLGGSAGGAGGSGVVIVRYVDDPSYP